MSKKPSLSETFEKHLFVYGEHGVLSSHVKIPINNRVIEIYFDRHLTDYQILTGERQVEISTSLPESNPRFTDTINTNLPEMWELLKEVNKRTYNAKKVIVTGAPYLYDLRFKYSDEKLFGRSEHYIGTIKMLDKLAQNKWIPSKVDKQLKFPAADRPDLPDIISMEDIIARPPDKIKSLLGLAKHEESKMISGYCHREISYNLENTHTGKIQEIKEHLQVLDDILS